MYVWFRFPDHASSNAASLNIKMMRCEREKSRKEVMNMLEKMLKKTGKKLDQGKQS